MFALFYALFHVNAGIDFIQDRAVNFEFWIFGDKGPMGRRANNGVSRYPSYQKIFQLAENFTTLCQNWTNFPWISSISWKIFFETIQIRLF